MKGPDRCTHNVYGKSYCVATNYCILNRVSDYGAMNYGPTASDANIHQDLSSYGYSSYGNTDFNAGFNHGFSDSDTQNMFSQSVPVSEHVEVTNPVVVPVIKNIGKILPR